VRAIRLFPVALVLIITTAASGTENVLHTFQGGSDCSAYGSLILDPSGNLYGTATGSFGTNGEVYELIPGAGGWTETVIYNFGNPPDGQAPEGGVVRDAAGNLYGSTSRGGTSGRGTIYELTYASGSWTETVLYSFTGGTDGASPEGSLTLDQAGNLYGTTTYGGGSNAGVVFKLTHNSSGWTESVLYSFTGSNDGGEPMSGVIFDPAGNLYGTATQVGTLDSGVVFKLTPGLGAWTETVLYAFTLGNDGGDPIAPLTRANSGILYGAANAGGSGQAGVVYQLQPSASAIPSLGGAWVESVLYSFSGGNDGSGANTGVVFNTAGDLNGTTSFGGADNFGVVYQLTPSDNGWTENVLYSFTDGADGGFPESTLAIDGSGNLYGTTVAGGVGCGVAYEIPASN
jgi:uncharacterized repeat protein (TIGR03803 family)